MNKLYCEECFQKESGNIACSWHLCLTCCQNRPDKCVLQCHNLLLSKKPIGPLQTGRSTTRVMREAEEIGLVLKEDEAHQNRLLQETDRQMCLRILIHHIRILEENNRILSMFLEQLPAQSSCVGCILL